MSRTSGPPSGWGFAVRFSVFLLFWGASSAARAAGDSPPKASATADSPASYDHDASNYLSPTSEKVGEDWLFFSAYKGKDTNEVIWDRRFEQLLADHLPKIRLDLGIERGGKRSRLKDALMEVLGGPSTDVRMPDDHTIVLSACRLHSCDEKGFMWLDIRNRKFVTAIVHYIFQGKYYGADNPQLLLASNDSQCKLSSGVKNEIKAWLKPFDLTVGKVRCVRNGQLVELLDGN